MMRIRGTTRALCVAAVAATLAACAVHAPLETVPSPDRSGVAMASLATPATSAEWPARDWWTTLGDPQLTKLIEQALADSPTLEGAVARLDAAAARAAATRAPLIPSVDANAAVQRSLFSNNGLFPPPIGGSTIWQNSASLGLHWDLDFWGRHRSALQGALRDVDAAAVDRDGASLALSTAIARRYIEWQRIIDQLELAQAVLSRREALLALTQKRVDAGLDSAVQLKGAEGAVPETRADITALESLATLARLELAALAGAGPDRANELARPSLLRAPLAGAPAVLPADLLARRPDVLASRLRVEAASARADAAQADFYPNINLAATVGLDSKSFTDWAEGDSLFYNVGPALNLPLFGGGRRRATLALRTAEHDELVAAYRGTLVGAARDVAAVLAEMAAIDAEARDAALAVRSQSEAHELAERRYAGGLGRYTDVLLAEAAVLGQRRRVVDLNARRLDASVRLVAALGGGLPPAATVSANRSQTP